MPMDVRAAVAYAPGKPLEVTTVKLEQIPVDFTHSLRA
jgi:Zn-dependent alcohol dehydrogenase